MILMWLKLKNIKRYKEVCLCLSLLLCIWVLYAQIGLCNEYLRSRCKLVRGSKKLGNPIKSYKA